MSGHASRRSFSTIKQMFLTLACVLACLMAVHVVQAQDAMPAASNSEKSVQTAKADQEGEWPGTPVIARYYAKRFKGKKTSSGEIYDPKKLTAAHATLPLGTEVKVINPLNSRSVTVTVNDRCRKRKEPYIDLSRQAARELGILRQGKANVRMIPLTEDDDEDSSNTEPQSGQP